MLLTVFRGGFTRAAAQQVAGATLQQLAGLVNKSFLSRNPISGRLEIHGLLRQYGQDQLGKQTQARASAHEAHAAYYAAFMHARWEHLKDNRQMQALAEIEADIENVRAAWQFYLDQRNAAQMDFFLNSFWIVYLIRGWNHAAAGLFGKAQEALSELLGDLKAKAVHAIGMAMQGFFLAWLGLADQGYPLAKESVEILERLDNPTGLVFACNGLSLTTYYLNRSNEEKEAAQKVLQVARASDDKWLLAFALYLASQAAFRVKDYGEAKELSEASLKIGEELGEVVVSAWPLTALGQIAFLHGELEKAKEFYLRCLDESRKMGYRWAIGNSIKYLGQIALLEGDEVEAEKYFIQSLKIAHELGLDRDITNHLFEFARLRVAQARPAEAVEIIGLLLQQPASHQARLGEGRIRDSAKALLAKLEDELSAQSYSEALTSGQEFEMDAVIMRLVGPNS